MDRTKGIGGTDIAAIVGLNPWKSAIDVYMEKLGLTEPQEDNDNLWWGREMEPILQKRYEQETGLTVLPFNSEFHILDKIKNITPWYVGTPDGMILDSNNHIWMGVDYKTTGSSYKSDWGEPGSDEVPPYYHTQAMWYMGLTGARWWDIAVLFMGARREFRIYRINRDDELIATLIEKGKDFWENHVLSQVPPPVDSSPGWDKYFKSRFPKEELPLLETTGEIDNDLRSYHGVCEKFKAVSANKEYWENHIKAYIGSCAGINTPVAKVTWKKSKDRTKVDWEKAFNDLAAKECLTAQERIQLINLHTTITTGPRIFRATWNKEKDNE
jgi:putative phage-type endonuclease